MRESRIRIGNQTAASAAHILDPFEFAIASGFDAFEWFPDKNASGNGWEEHDLDAAERRRIKDAGLKHDIRMSVHVPWHINPLDEGAWEHVQKDLDLARDIGAQLLNVHLFAGEESDAFPEKLLTLIRRCAEYDIQLSFENTVLTGPDDFNRFFRKLRERNIPGGAHIGMCLDLGHANLFEETRNDYLRFVELIDPDVPIIHVHLHENYGDGDTHLPLFTGPSAQDPSGIKGLMERLRKRNFSGSLILEQWPQPPSLLKNAHSRLREMAGLSRKPARVEAVTGQDAFADTLIEADRGARSWREKLIRVHDLVTRNDVPLTPDVLAYLAVYLRFIGTGEIPGAEGGGHYRPSHHARMAKEIHSRLSKISSPENALIIRKILPWLPSFDSPFLRSEPLTRIRDIAHRNDIPRELKQEIKHTLQNKLHRNAGPEDLLTSEAILARITAPGSQFPTEFVAEFRKFHDELKEFFHARTLDEELAALEKAGNGEGTSLIRRFLRAKGRTGNLGAQLNALGLLTRLREHLAEESVHASPAWTQKLQLTDIKLEEFSFMLLSTMIGDLYQREGALPWEQVLTALGLTAANLRLGGIGADECRAIESELNAWKKRFDADDREQLLRLKATLDRCRRLPEEYISLILELFPEKAEILGHALGVAEHAIRVFSESDIRSHPVFQFSKITALLSKYVRSLADLPAWDAVVSGAVSGRLFRASRLELAEDFVDETTIVLLQKAEGDEEIPPKVGGIVLAHEIPHLSHLAVRARQGEIPFAVCEDPHVSEELSGLEGKQIDLVVTGTSVDITLSKKGGEKLLAGRRKTGSSPPGLIAANLSSKGTLLSLDSAERDSCGGKAYSARLLEELSGRSGSGFRTLTAMVIPFGVMEASLRSTPAREQEYRSLAIGLNELPQDRLADSLKRLRELIGQLEVPRDVLTGIRTHFRKGSRLMVRSSCSAEDLEGFSGAGLYDSVADVDPSSPGEAIKHVWASLWNRRAAISRRNAGIPHDRIFMAVMIQQMMRPDYSFIMHAVDPVSNDAGKVYLEFAVGLGETLASGNIPGNPYRVVWDEMTGESKLLAFASFSTAAWPGRRGALSRETIDYTTVRLSTDTVFRQDVFGRAGAVGKYIEQALGKPQDIEGLIADDTLYVVQSRPQQGLGG